MTLDEFFLELEKLPKRYGLFQRRTFSVYRRGIRDQHDRCPICAVAYAKGLGDLTWNYDIAGERLGLSLADAHAIANAADYRNSSNMDMRIRLERALGLAA